MITLFDENIYMENRASSKGNQLKGNNLTFDFDVSIMKQQLNSVCLFAARQHYRAGNEGIG